MQSLDPEGVYTDEQVLRVLSGMAGAREFTFSYDRLDKLNNYIGPIYGVTSGQVDYNFLADIKRTARFRIQDLGEVNYLSDRIRPWAVLRMPDGGDVRWPQGVFLLSTPTRVRTQAGDLYRDVDAYDQLLVLRDSKSTARYSIAAGTVYTTAISTLIALDSVVANMVPSILTLPVAMEWEPGTSHLQILNDLLGAINYESAFFNELGYLICRPYLSPSDRPSEFAYITDASSVITGDVGQTVDLFDVPNQWTIVVSEADRAVLVSSYTNSNPASPTSTVSRGRTISDYRTEQDAADQTTLDALVARLAFEASQVYEVIEFKTILMPIHSNADVYDLEIADVVVNAKYGETGWSLPLEAGAQMTHKVRRVVFV